MNCNACLSFINRDRGYYLVEGEPYCLKCYQKPEDADEMAGLTHLSLPFKVRKTENLLEAFRAYQKRNRASLVRRL